MAIVKTEQEIRDQIKSLEEGIIQLKPGKREDGIFLFEENVSDLKLMYEGSLNALYWILGEEKPKTTRNHSSQPRLRQGQGRNSESTTDHQPVRPGE